jgi:hypothetical protein
MKKLLSVMVALLMMASLLVTTVSAAPAALLTPTVELGQLKVCKVAGSGVELGTLFTFQVNGSPYSVPAGPADRNGYCILAGQYPVNTQVTIEEVIPSGYFVSRIEVKPDRTISKDTGQGTVTVNIVSGVIEAIFTNKVAGSPTPTRTPTSVHTSTPRPTRTPPSCDPNCTATPTPVPMGRMQICKEAEGPGVSGYFTFRFETRSRSVPVGACAGLIAVNAGTVTITETAQAGFAVAEIYTIPADRLISKDLAVGSATVRIVEGTAISQTIVIFRNKAMTTTTHTATPTGATVTPSHTATPTSTGSVTATFTPTPTGSVTPTSTPPPTVCPPTVIYADFNRVAVGQSVEGLDTVAPFLNIDARGTAVRVSQTTEPMVYLAPNGSGNINGGLVADGGFSDVTTKVALQPHLYTFTFAPGVSVTNFSLHMLDYGDWNYTRAASHFVSMTAYDTNGQEIPNAKQVLSYTSPALEVPRTSSLYGDLHLTGDAVTAPPAQPGNWIWNVSGSGIVKVVLEFGVGYDPNIGFDLLSFTTECASCQSLVAANVSSVPVGQSVEGLGAVAPHLNIDARGTAVRVSQATEPMVYLAPNGSGNINGGLVADGGFSDVTTKVALQPHLYTFTFATSVSITNFSLHMLDYGDWNYTRAASHYASMTAYNANGNVVSKEELSYTSPALEVPRTSSLYGDLYFTGDAVSSPVGQPGNWIWNVSGNGIVRIVLEFGAGYDPNIAFDLLSYNVVCQ